MAHDTIVYDTGAPIDLPFAFRLGLVGYLGYEVRRETADYPGETSEKSAPEPDAAFIRCGRAVVIRTMCVDPRVTTTWHGLRRRLASDGRGRRPSSKAYTKKVREA